jgi:uncharacterized protein (DUF1684 family)
MNSTTNAMNKRIRYTIFAGVAVAVAFIFFYTLNNTATDENYARNIRQQRQKKDTDFKYADFSPLTIDQKHKFKNLDYFAPDEKYKITAQIRRTNNDTIYKYLTTSNEIRKFYKYAIAEFTIDNKAQTLLVLKSADAATADYFLLAFKDLTSGTETYEGGRYIDIEAPKNEKLVIDFNNAYNPYCAYNEMYSCPIPPEENNLTTRILAGERVFKE